MRHSLLGNLVVLAATTTPSLGRVSVAQWKVGEAIGTTSGYVKGHASEWMPEVSEYLGIPYAEPPVGDLRFAAPRALSGEDGGRPREIVADKFVRFGCVQYMRLTK